MDRKDDPVLLMLVAAFAAVYLIWGSTFLAIRIALETIPPFLMAAIRFSIAGLLLHVSIRIGGNDEPLTWRHWCGGFFTGGLLFLGGNGALVWGEQRVDSGLAALLFTAIPIWMILLDSLHRRKMPHGGVLAGVAIGLAGIVLLIGPAELAGSKRPDLFASLILILGTISWSVGSLSSRWFRLPSSLYLTASIQLLCGGILLFCLSVVLGEPHENVIRVASFRSLLALGYLIGFGSLIAFSAYVWLLKNTTAGHVSTYALVNPVVAVVLGWYFGGEKVTARTLMSIPVILLGVVLITLYGRFTKSIEDGSDKESLAESGEKICQASES